MFSKNWWNRQTRSLYPVEADEKAVYEDILEYELSSLEPQVARPHRVDNVSPVEEVAGQKIDRAFLGTCTNGKLDDISLYWGMILWIG